MVSVCNINILHALCIYNLKLTASIIKSFNETVIRTQFMYNFQLKYFLKWDFVVADFQKQYAK